MWPRIVEVMLALWLILSPFIFDVPGSATGLWVSSIASGAAIMLISLISIWPRALRAHLLNLLIGAWLLGYGYFTGGYPADPGWQNHIVVGLILLLFAIIPTDADRPPRSWRRWYEGRDESR